MSTDSPYYFYLSKSPSPVFAANNDLKSYFGEDGGFIVVPYFPQPPYREPLTVADTKNVQLQYLAEFLKSSDNVAEEYWFALVMPEKEGGSMEALEVVMEGELKLMRDVSTFHHKYIGTLAASAVSG